MGWAKYHEDIQDAITDAQIYSAAGVYTVMNTEPPTYNCAYCNLSFYSKNELFEHIKNAHSGVSSLVIVNGKIINKECYVKKVSSLKIIRYDFNKDIFINEKKIEGDEEAHELDITNLVQPDIETNKKITVQIGDKKYAIHRISQEYIDVEKINAIINEWNNQVAKGSHIEKTKKYSNELEQRCLDGVYNYFTACVAEGQNKVKRYNEAYAILTEVYDILPSAKIILKVIALKYNWIEKLNELCVKKDTFSTICDFMSNKKSFNFEKQEGALQLYIEDEIEEIIHAIIAFQKNDMAIVDKYLERYPGFSSLQQLEINHKDRICLLFARRAVKNGHKLEARRYYSEIQTMYFETEKTNFIKSL